jgi:hypothetical protein
MTDVSGRIAVAVRPDMFLASVSDERLRRARASPIRTDRL